MATMTRDELKNLIDRRPEGTTPEGIVAALRERGIQMEGYPADASVAPQTGAERVAAIQARLPGLRQQASQAQQEAQASDIGAQLRGTLLQGARGINSMMPAIGGAIGGAAGGVAGAGAAPLTGGLSLPGGVIGGGMLGAGVGRAAEMALAPLLGQTNEIPSGPTEAYANIANSATGGAIPGAIEETAKVVGPVVARKLAEASIRHGYGDPRVLARTMIQYGIQNGRDGVKKIANLVGQISRMHNQGIEDMSRGSRPTWGAIQDYMTPALAPIRRELLNENLPAAEKAALRSAVNEFVSEHGIPVPPRLFVFGNPRRAAAQQVVRGATDEILKRGGSATQPVTAEHAAFLNPDEQFGLGFQRGGIRDRTIGIKQLNALKEDADHKLRFLREQIAKRTTDAIPTPAEATRMRVYEALGNRARELMYGPLDDAGVRAGGVAEHLQHLDAEQNKLLSLKTNIGPDARLRVGRARTIAERAAVTLPMAGAAGLLMPGPAAAHAAAAAGAGIAGAALTGPTALSGMALLMANPLLARNLANAARVAQAGGDVAISRGKKK